MAEKKKNAASVTKNENSKHIVISNNDIFSLQMITICFITYKKAI